MIVLPFANSNSPCTYRFIEFGHFMPMNMNILEIVMLVCDVVICQLEREYYEIIYARIQNILVMFQRVFESVAWVILISGEWKLRTTKRYETTKINN